MRIRSLLPIIALLAVACTTDRAPTVPSGNGADLNDVVPPSGSLDQNIRALIDLFPKGLANSASERWRDIKREVHEGRTERSDMRAAKAQLFELSEWVQDKTPRMSNPPNNESKANAATRLILYMSLYVYGGPDSPVPAFPAGADNVVGLVTPSRPATIVTPTKHAGVALEARSVRENTIVVITENPTFYPGPCGGPLKTTSRVCQYPLFYTFNEFPHRLLRKAGRFAVCHVTNGEGNTRGPSAAAHLRMRLAHTLPANKADYTPGSLTGEQYGNIEILPLTTQTFSSCPGTPYRVVMNSPLDWFARAVAWAVTPKSAYAIDRGGGGESLSFSDFNDVDPDAHSDAADFSGDGLKDLKATKKIDKH